MFCLMRAGVVLIRDSHNDFIRIDVYPRLGKGGDMSRLIECRHRLTEIAGEGHTYIYILFGVQVLRMFVALCDQHVNALMPLQGG